MSSIRSSHPGSPPSSSPTQQRKSGFSLDPWSQPTSERNSPPHSTEPGTVTPKTWANGYKPVRRAPKYGDFSSAVETTQQEEPKQPSKTPQPGRRTSTDTTPMRSTTYPSPKHGDLSAQWSPSSLFLNHADTGAHESGYYTGSGSAYGQQSTYSGGYQDR